MSTPDRPDEVVEFQRDGAGRQYLEAEVLPELSTVLSHAGRLPGLTVTDTTQSSGEWILTFTYQGHRFGIHTVYDADVSLYSTPDPDCPEALLREVVVHLEGSRVPRTPWVPPPPLDGRRLLWLFLVALAVAVPLVVFLVLFRKS